MINFKLALRSIIFRFRQYVALFIICALATAFSLGILYLSKGMLKALSEKAKVYYGGDLVLTRFPKNDYGLHIENYKQHIETLKSVFPSDAVISERYDFDAKNTTSLFYDGNESSLSMIKGIRYETEAFLINHLTFIYKNEQTIKDGKWAFISSAVAKRLKIENGDSFVLYLQTYEGYINTIELQVAGIFEDSSVFGMYTMYMDFDLLKEVCPRGENWANRICVNFPKRNQISDEEINEWNESLKQYYPMFKVCSDKKEFYAGIPYPEDIYALIPLKANLNDTSILEKALNLVISGIIFIMVLITIIGISSTFKVIVAKRAVEIGIYKSIGMKTYNMIISFVCETFIVLVLGCLCGCVLSGLICGTFRLIDLSFISNLNIFLSGGRIYAQFDLKMTLLLIAAIIVTTLVAVLFSIKKYVTILPVKALFTNK